MDCAAPRSRPPGKRHECLLAIIGEAVDSSRWPPLAGASALEKQLASYELRNAPTGAHDRRRNAEGRGGRGRWCSRRPALRRAARVLAILAAIFQQNGRIAVPKNRTPYTQPALVSC